MEFNEKLVRDYAKRIMGFAYDKTKNITEAEDLSQEILLSLTKALQRHQEITDPDGFVYKVCCYTWSRFLRKNKRHWNNLDVDLLFDLQSEHDAIRDAEKNLMTEKLKKEIAYLSKLHREITLLFYYENRTGSEISAILQIPHSTVRWHLSEIKKKLKEGIEMNNSLHESPLQYKPQRLLAGHSGFVAAENGMKGLGSDRIVDNICLACYGKALTLEEISRALMVPAGYIEHHIENLVFMDYLRVVQKNKYTTNFFIAEMRHKLLVGKYHYHNIEPYARKIYGAFEKRFEKIKSIGFLGSDLDKDFLLWAMIPLASNMLYYTSLASVLKRNNIVLDAPVRKDGSQHWVCAMKVDDRYLDEQTEFTKEEMDFYYKSSGNGVKLRDDGQGRMSFQLDSRATINIGIYWRHFDAPDLVQLHRISEMIRNNETPNEMDKIIIAQKVEQGYVRMENGKPKMLIPFIAKHEHDRLNEILEDMMDEIGSDLFAEYIETFAEQFDKEIPPFISENERNFNKYDINPIFAILYWLADNGFLRYPDEEEAKRLCTVVWCTK